MRIFLFLALATIGLYACQKKDNTTTDASKVVINVTAPASGQIYHTGDSIHVVSSVSYPSELHGYEVKITDSATGYIIYDDAQHVHNDHFDISDAFLNTGSTGKVLKLEMIVKLDDNGTSVEKTVRFVSQP